MRLDPTVLRYLSKDEFRTLVAIELGQKNHEIVPTPLIVSISRLKRGGTHKALVELHKNKLIVHDGKKYDGYKLTYLGYDFLALKAFVSRGSVSLVGPKIGVGKESDIYKVSNDNDDELVLKLHRLGRISFRAIKEKRDYLKHRKNASWLYLSRLAALKEYAYMKALYDNGFPVPKPYDVNRHCVVMQHIKATPMINITAFRHPQRVYSGLMNLIIRLASYGLIHGDFNEFNLLVDDEENITLIDFPQMVSTSHLNAQYYFERDVQCVRTFFERKIGFHSGEYPRFEDYCDSKEHSLDVEIEASGFTKKEQAELEVALNEENEAKAAGEGEHEDEEDEDEDDSDEDSEEDSDEEGDKKKGWKSIAFGKSLNRSGSALPVRIENDEEEDDDYVPAQEQQTAREKVLAQLALDRKEAGLPTGEPKEGEESTEQQEEEVGEVEEEEVGEEEMIRKKVKKVISKKQSSGNRWKRNAVKQNKKKENRLMNGAW